MPPPRRLVPRSQYGNIQVLTEGTIGLPIQFTDGPYAGKTILTCIEEVQKPDLGRKYGQRDSRPVDPPPVVQVRMIQIFDYDSPGERRVELDVSDIFLPGLICYAELFPYNADFDHDPRIYPDGRPPPTPIQPLGAPDAGRPLACANTYPPDNLPRQPRIPLTRDAALPLQLHGERHQNVIAVPDIRGSAKKVLYFVFSELQVRLTGHFMLKYTAMHIDHTLAEHKKAPLLAECWGGVFAVYPSKQHPALKQSTELTNHLSRCGSKLHSRHKQRVGRGSVTRLDGKRDSPPTPEPTLPSKRLHSETNGKKNGVSETNGKPTKKPRRSASDTDDDANGKGEDTYEEEEEDDHRPTASSSKAFVPPPRSNGHVERARSQTIDDRAAGLLLLGIGGHLKNQTSEATAVNGKA
ncbi:hypothetical protein AURDEDRAFT_117168 [Auricularia subglabra TFB-10046 SS5]|nr:hypothetical protein AURDEDRAFT_117168 [Auricularia subglabra TFB-10046 SS5]